MSDPFHHKHPYLTVIVLLIILLVISKFFQACSGPGVITIIITTISLAVITGIPTAMTGCMIGLSMARIGVTGRIIISLRVCLPL